MREIASRARTLGVARGKEKTRIRIAEATGVQSLSMVFS